VSICVDRPVQTLAAPTRLTRLDAWSCREHLFLAATDQCAYLSSYLAGAGYDACPGNQLMHNFKCAPSIAGHDIRRGHYKRQAIRTLAHWLRCAVPRELAEQCTWVPIPPSKRRDDPDYDDRLSQTLRRAFTAYDCDVRPLLYQVCSTVSDHAGGARLGSDTLHALLRLDSAALRGRPIRQSIVLFDDVLTSGKHFKCCERRLREALPCTPIAGVFLMRRVLSPPRRFAPPAPVPEPS